MWTTKNRAKYNRDCLQYPSDVTDEGWAYVAPLIPKAKSGGRNTKIHAIADAKGRLLSILLSGGEAHDFVLAGI
jgi:transposase